MKLELKMPDLSTTGGELTVLKWLVNVGSSARRGDPIIEVETDKATMAVESAHTGVLTQQLIKANESVLPGEVIAIIEVDRTKTVPVRTAIGRPEERKPQPGEENVGGTPRVTAVSDSPGSRVGMFARNRAGRPVSDATPTPLSTTQRAVARRMLQSKQTIPHFYLQTSVCLDPICKRRAESSDKTIAWEAYVVHAVAQSLKRYPKMCSRYQGDCLVFQPRGTIGVAVDVDRELYVVPIVDAAEKTVAQISEDIRAVSRQLKSHTNEELKRLQPADITITNLGMTVVESFVPIINPPEAAILGIGRVLPRPVAVDSQVVIQHRTTLTLAVDHRIVNGRYAAEFLSDLVEVVEESY
jgi:pyruvate dehydrogenase E2 component (dihydrolipoamide acetyltransferase)